MIIAFNIFIQRMRFCYKSHMQISEILMRLPICGESPDRFSAAHIHKKVNKDSD